MPACILQATTSVRVMFAFSMKEMLLPISRNVYLSRQRYPNLDIMLPPSTLNHWSHFNFKLIRLLIPTLSTLLSSAECRLCHILISVQGNAVNSLPTPTWCCCSYRRQDATRPGDASD